MLDLNGTLTAATDAARAAGEILCRMQGRVHPREKGPADLVSEADETAQAAIQDQLATAFPDFGFVGEESTAGPADVPRDPALPFWVVDPLDGTTNYVHGMHDFSVSIGLQQQDRLLVGVVFAPRYEEIFTATAETPTKVNGQPAQVSGTTSIAQSLLAASFAARPTSQQIARFVPMLSACRAVRRTGSAALNLSYVAAGRMDGYWATSLKPWDAAAGLLLVAQAGGSVSNLTGAPVDLADPQFVVAGSDTLRRQMIQVLDNR